MYFPDATSVTPYWVIDTDYTSYAVVYACFHVNATSGTCDSNQVNAWVVGRDKTLSEAKMNASIALIEDQLCLDFTQFHTIPQNNGKNCGSYSEHANEYNRIYMLMPCTVIAIL